MNDKPAWSDLDLLCNCLAARRASRYLTAVYDRALDPVGLRITQFTILHKLAREGALTIKRLAAEMAMDRTTLAANLKPLERDGLVAMSAAKDRRARLAQITATGEERIVRALPLWEQAQARFEGAYGADEAASLRAALGQVLEVGLDPWAE